MQSFTYVLGLDLVPGSVLQRALLDVNGRFWRFFRQETLEERDKRLGYGADDQSMWQELRIEDDNLRASYMNATRLLSSPLAKRAMEEIPLPPAYPHQRLISGKSTDQQALKDQKYKRDSALGSGITVFVLESGFGISGTNADELRVDPNNLAQNTWIVPNALALGMIPIADWVPEAMDDAAVAPGVASLAIGTKYGIASRADPYLIKLSGVFHHPNGQYVMISPCYNNLRYGYQHIVDIIKERNLQGKAVINFSGTTARDQWNPDDFPKVQRLTLDFMDQFAKLGVSFVISAGNDGDLGWGWFRFMGDFLPQRLGRPENALITVGSVFDDGKLFRGTSIAGSGLVPDGPTGSTTVWAQGVEVDVLRPNGQQYWRTGTSFAAPQVAGLIANFMSEDPDKFQWKDGYTEQDGIDLVMRIKKHIIDLSYDRHLAIDHTPACGGPLPYNLPLPINVAYNGAWGPHIPYHHSLRVTKCFCWKPDIFHIDLVAGSVHWTQYVPDICYSRSSTSSTISSWASVSLTTSTLQSTPSASTPASSTTGAIPPSSSNVNNAACANPPKCDKCKDGFELACPVATNGGSIPPCECQWQSGCTNGQRYNECENLDCRKHYHQTMFCEELDTGMYPHGHCICREHGLSRG
ncbi:subtilisin [Apiospora aurea]|uniref:Subtilisin n=1 Tax=Apiospora aurea TaxID=335848 RepID=A0ABR1Q592_9PEZI